MEKTGLVILLCRNAIHYSRHCLDTLLAQTVPVSILVVDNASTDGTAKYMAAQQCMHSRIYRMTYPTVTSVARCWNEGLTWGWGRGHKEALVVNNDTELLPATYEKLVARIHAHHQGMLTAVGVDKDPSYPRKVTQRLHPDYSCYMLTQWAHKLVPFDQGYEGGYFEDADHHVRLYRAGIWAGSINLGFLHHSSGTLQSADAKERERINNNYQRNKDRFLRQYGCVPGTKPYERLFLPADGRADDVAADSEQAEEPQAEQQHHHDGNEGLDRGGHRDVGLNQPEHHADNH